MRFNHKLTTKVCYYKYSPITFTQFYSFPKPLLNNIGGGFLLSFMIGVWGCVWGGLSMELWVCGLVDWYSVSGVSGYYLL